MFFKQYTDIADYRQFPCLTQRQWLSAHIRCQNLARHEYHLHWNLMEDTKQLTYQSRIPGLARTWKQYIIFGHRTRQHELLVQHAMCSKFAMQFQYTLSTITLFTISRIKTAADAVCQSPRNVAVAGGTVIKRGRSPLPPPPGYGPGRRCISFDELLVFQPRNDEIVYHSNICTPRKCRSIAPIVAQTAVAAGGQLINRGPSNNRPRVRTLLEGRTVM